MTAQEGLKRMSERMSAAGAMGPKAAPRLESEYNPKFSAGRLPGTSSSLSIQSPASEIKTGPKGADVHLIFRIVRLTESSARRRRLALQGG
jgi:hypothetical protein